MRILERYKMKICTVENCNKKIKGRGLCGMHWARLVRHGDVNYESRNYNYGDICTINGCGRKYATKGFCSAHYKRYQKYGNPLIEKPLKIQFKNSDEFFENKILKTDACWIWQGTIMNSGYGELKYQGKTWGAHRYSYFKHYGDFDKNLFVCHHCDNKLCVNPGHLFLGTNQDNVNDMMKKNRHYSQKLKN